MVTVEIYRDNNTIIEVAEWFDDWCFCERVPQVYMTNEQLALLSLHIFKNFREVEFDYSDTHIIFADTAPILRCGDMIHLKAPFDVFSLVSKFLPDLEEPVTKEQLDVLNRVYAGLGMQIVIGQFQEDFQDVSGYIALKSKVNLRILPYKVRRNRKERIDLNESIW